MTISRTNPAEGDRPAQPGRPQLVRHDSQGQATRLIVNADDFGYSAEVSRGIVECANRGIVTATGVFGNAPALSELKHVLADAPHLETGVHLSLSHGEPCTDAMRRALVSSGGRFPDKFRMALLISRNRIRESVLRAELYAQVDACVKHGLRIAFLNAHEHLHMHPRVFPIVCELARKVGVRFVRVTRPDVVGGGGLGGFMRGLIIRCLAPGDVSAIDTRIQLLGLARSGRIDISYMEAAFALLRPGRTYELMCHPGYHDPVLARDEKLLRYHDWDLERRTLQDPRLPELMHAHGIELVGFGALSATQAA